MFTLIVEKIHQGLAFHLQYKVNHVEHFTSPLFCHRLDKLYLTVSFYTHHRLQVALVVDVHGGVGVEDSPVEGKPQAILLEEIPP